MKIKSAQIPSSITSFSFSPRKIVTDEKTINFLDRAYEQIFGVQTIECAIKLDIDLFFLVFVNEKPFSDFASRYISQIDLDYIEYIKTALLIRFMYKGEKVSISSLSMENDQISVGDPVYCRMNSGIGKNSDANIHIEEKNSKKRVVLNKKSLQIMEGIRLSAIKYGMNEAIEYKNLLDKYNYRRFTSGIKFNNRPTSIDVVNHMLEERRDKSFADLSDTATRINFTSLFAIAFGGFTIEDLYEKETVFKEDSLEKEKKLIDLSNAFIDIIKTGNGIEIAHTYIKMVKAFTELVPPDINMNDLASVMDNYPVYYAAATMAVVCERIFSSNEDLKLYMKKHTIYNYWNYVEKVILMKQYVLVLSFCRKMAKFSIDDYLSDSSYRDEILFSFERAFKFSYDIKKARGEEEIDFEQVKNDQQ